MIALIAAVDQQGCIAKAGKIPWDLPKDRQRFRTLTWGHVVVMGRKTFESLPHPYLEGRTLLILTSASQYPIPPSPHKVFTLNTPHFPSQLIEVAPLIWIAGGEAVYAHFLPQADWVELTKVETTVGGDRFFPLLFPEEWTRVDREFHPADNHHAFAYSFQSYVRLHRPA